MISIRRTGVIVAAFCAAGLLVAACGSSSTTTATTKAAAPATVRAASTSLGSVLVDPSGRTLYRFDHDTAGAGTSACNATCATTWPADLVTGTPTAGTGVTGTLAVLTRSDGGQQLTVDGHPLYHFSGDKAPGDTNGNGIGGIWHVVSASGASGQGTTGATTTTAGGYHY